MVCYSPSISFKLHHLSIDGESLLFHLEDRRIDVCDVVSHLTKKQGQVRSGDFTTEHLRTTKKPSPSDRLMVNSRNKTNHN